MPSFIILDPVGAILIPVHQYARMLLPEGDKIIERP